MSQQHAKRRWPKWAQWYGLDGQPYTRRDYIGCLGYTAIGLAVVAVLTLLVIWANGGITP